MNTDELIKISIVILILTITVAIVIQLGITLFTVNSIAKDLKKVSGTLVNNPYQARLFIIETVYMLIEDLVSREVNKVKSSALGGALKVLQMVTKKKKSEE